MRTHVVTGWRASPVVFALLAFLVFPPVCLAGENLLKNPGFEMGLNDNGEPPGWHTKLTSITPIPEYRDPENKKGRTGKYTFKDGCGHIWGAVRPWTFLFCPQCKRLNTGLEDSADWYLDNEKFVTLVPGRTGKAIGFRMPQAVADVEGARVFSDLIKAQRGAGYEFAFDAYSEGPALRAFVEGFRLETEDKEAAQWAATLEPEVNPLKQQYRLKRIYRKQIHPEPKGGWTRFSEKFVPPSERHAFDYMFVNLYAYAGPGGTLAAYDNVVLRQLTPAELRQHLKDNPGPSDPRFR